MTSRMKTNWSVWQVLIWLTFPAQLKSSAQPPLWAFLWQTSRTETRETKKTIFFTFMWTYPTFNELYTSGCSEWVHRSKVLLSPSYHSGTDWLFFIPDLCGVRFCCRLSESHASSHRPQVCQQSGGHQILRSRHVS